MMNVNTVNICIGSIYISLTKQRNNERFLVYNHKINNNTGVTIIDTTLVSQAKHAGRLAFFMYGNNMPKHDLKLEALFTQALPGVSHVTLLQDCYLHGYKKAKGEQNA